MKKKLLLYLSFVPLLMVGCDANTETDTITTEATTEESREETTTTISYIEGIVPTETESQTQEYTEPSLFEIHNNTPISDSGINTPEDLEELNIEDAYTYFICNPDNPLYVTEDNPIIISTIQIVAVPKSENYKGTVLEKESYIDVAVPQNNTVMGGYNIEAGKYKVVSGRVWKSHYATVENIDNTCYYLSGGDIDYEFSDPYESDAIINIKEEDVVVLENCVLEKVG